MNPRETYHIEVLAAEDEAKAGERMDDLLRFVLSDRWSKLRKQIALMELKRAMAAEQRSRSMRG